MKNTIDLEKFGGSQLFNWDHEHLVKVLTTGKSPIVKSLYLRNAFRNIRRGDFVDANNSTEAFRDTEISLDYGESITKPTVVAFMLELMKPKLGGTYLDIGTGSGWVAALLSYAAGMDGMVYSIERIQFIYENAKKHLQQYPNLKNIKLIFGDGAQGLPAHQPYDGIYVSAAYSEIPTELKEQLKINGRLVIPTLKNEVVCVERIDDQQFREKIYPGYFFKNIESGIL